MNESSLSSVSWASHLRALYAIVVKDWLHFIRYPLNALFGVLQPITWLLPVYFMGKSFATPEGNVGFAAYTGTVDYMSFILLGAVLSEYLSAVLWGMGYSLKNEMDSGVLEANWMTPMPRALLLVGRTIASLGITTVNALGVLLLGWLLFGFRITGSLLGAVGSALPMLIALYGFGFAFAALVLLVREPNTMIDVGNFVLMGLSGSNFPIQVLPRFLVPVSLAIPLTYGYDAVRGYLLHTRTILPLRLEIAILIGFMGLMVPLGYLIFRGVERRCRQLGTLGMH